MGRKITPIRLLKRTTDEATFVHQKNDMKNIKRVLILPVTIASFLSCKKENASPDELAIVIQANGEIQDDVEAFKNMLGPLNTSPGAVGGHREIDWDKTPDSLLDQAMPADFSNPTGEKAVASMQRGVVYTPGKFMVSSTGFAA